MSDLFELPESLSPRLKWMREHGLSLVPGYNHDDEEEIVGVYRGEKLISEGITELEALSNAARKLNLKLWNE